MAELSREQFEAASQAGGMALAEHPRAATACYDRRLGRVIVEFANGCTFAFPPRLAQGLAAASEAQLAQVEILGAGTGLHWDDLDVDLSVPGLLAGLFGTASYMAGRAGRTTSPAKAAAARANGAQGGRPRKLAPP